MRLIDFPSAALYAGLLAFCCSPSQAEEAPAAVSWEALCAVSVCRATGHDGASAVDFSPDGRHLVVAAASQDKSGLYLVERDGKSRFWTEGHSTAWLADGNGIVFVRDEGRPQRQTRMRKPVFQADPETSQLRYLSTCHTPRCERIASISCRFGNAT